MPSLYDDPTIYDAIFPVGGPADAFYRGVARRTGGPVLELACGTGRFTVPLARDGHVVVGLDQSPAMLALARDKARAAGVNVDFVAGDMRDFALARAFALVLIATNSLLHLHDAGDLVRALACARAHLAADGRVAGTAAA